MAMTLGKHSKSKYTGSGWSARRLNVTSDVLVLWLLMLFAAVSWSLLAWWYSLPANETNTHFAFEKIPGGFASPILRGTLLLFLLLGAVYAGGYYLISRQARLSQSVKTAIVLFISLPAIANLLIYPVGALDVFNYMIELKLAYGYAENPYLVTFAGYRDDPFALPAFLVNVPLFYGPVWLIAYGLPVAVAGFGTIIGLLGALKLFNLGLLALIAVLIYRSQEDDRAGWLGVYLFLANPLVLFEGIGNAHNDVLMTMFLVAAVFVLRRKPEIAGPLLALSALVKLFTIALAPLFFAVAWRDRWGWRRFALSGSLALLIVVITVTPFWADGAMIDGLRRGTAKSQEMNHVSVLSLAHQAVKTSAVSSRLTPLFATGIDFPASVLGKPSESPGRDTKPLLRLPSLAAKQTLVTRVCAALFIVLALAIAVAVARGQAIEAGIIDTLLLFLLLLTNLYPWYLIPIVAILALWQNRGGPGLGYLFVATILGLAYYPAYVYARYGSDWSELSLHLFLALFLTVPILLYLLAEITGFAFRVPGRR